MTLRELAQALGAELMGGDPTTRVVGVSGLDNAAPGYVAYVENGRRQKQGDSTEAVALIAPLDLEPGEKPLLRVANPRLAYARALGLLSPRAHPAPGIHATAVIGEGVTFGGTRSSSPAVDAIAAGVFVGAHAVIGDGCTISRGVQIHPLVAIGNDVRIGAGSEIHANVTVYHSVTIGERVVICAGSVIGGDGFGYARDGDAHVRIPHIGTVIVEDDVEIGCNVTIDRSTTGATVIGQGSKLDNLVHIAHNVKIGRHTLLMGQVGISGSVTIGDNVMMAGQAGAKDHVAIGDNVQAGARAAIRSDIPAGTIVWGDPARSHREQLRIDGAMPRLPKLLSTVRELERRVRELEAKLGERE
jgi:UDP-3-O-[3-hydroxymyristoyl] glucosamine N-acyltransferase